MTVCLTVGLKRGVPIPKTTGVGKGGTRQLVGRHETRCQSGASKEKNVARLFTFEPANFFDGAAAQ